MLSIYISDSMKLKYDYQAFDIFVKLSKPLTARRCSIVRIEIQTLNTRENLVADFHCAVSSVSILI